MLEIIVYTSLAILLAVALDFGLMRWLRQQSLADEISAPVQVLGMYSPVLTWLKYRRLPVLKVRPISWAGLKRLRPAAEIGFIVLWALWITRVYLNLDPTMWPRGEDFSTTVEMFFTWRWLARCGACVLWNGSINGGVPAFADIYTPVLHPVFILTTLIWGGINGAKIMVIASIAIAGIAQWWLAKVMRLGFVARMWVAVMAVISGHLWARMEYGLVSMVFTTAMSALIYAPALDLARTGRPRAIVTFGVVMALALLSGHGYMQLGIIFGVLPALLIFLFDGRLQLRPVWRGFALAALLSLLLTAVWWVPLAHFWPHISKSGDPTFALAQPSVVYSLLNLVIGDVNFLYSAVLKGKEGPGTPALYSNYVGWVTVALALSALRLVPRRAGRTLAFILTAILLIYLTSTTRLFRPLNDYLGGLFSVGRDPSLIAPLAVPLVLGLAAWGLDRLLKLNWPKLALTLPSGDSMAFKIVWLMALPLLISLKSVYDLSRNWMIVQPVPDIDYPTGEVRLESSEWVRVPLERPYVVKAVDAGLKIVAFRDIIFWNWADREAPAPFFELARFAGDTASPDYRKTLAGGVNLFSYPDNEYALVTAGDRKIPCRAVAMAGNIDVTCQTDVPGVLTVYENWWAGWGGRRDGDAVSLAPGNWLSVPAPAGRHLYQFRYRPWDVVIGLILTGAGVLLAVWVWRQPDFETSDSILDAE